MPNSASKRTLSVKKRMMTLGVAAACGFASVIAVGWFLGAKVDTALHGAITVQTKLDNVNDMRLANTELVLAAMDSIIDSGEGQIAQERLDIMDQTTKLLADGSADLKSLASQVGKSDLTATYDEDLAALRQAIRVDLEALIRNGGSEEDYAKIDDVIDGAGERLGAVLEEGQKIGSGLLAERVGAATEASKLSLYVQMIIGLVAFVSVLLLQIIHGNSIVNGIQAVRTAMQKIIDGDYQSSVPHTDRGDEIGDIARSADLFRHAAIEKLDLQSTSERNRQEAELDRSNRAAAAEAEARAVKEAVDALAEGLNRLAEGDLTFELSKPFKADLERLRNDFNIVTTKLRTLVQQINGTTTSISANSNQMRSAADDLARRTEQQAASLEESSAALNQITATVRSSSDRAEEASHIVDAAKAAAEKSGKIVSDAVAAMERIENATGEIGEIINVVDEIAFQTNLLALNAGVEAARAGDAGKGFAVVAQEVRALAGRAADAARDIKALVGKSNTEVKTGVDLVAAAGSALTEIGDNVVQINDHVKSIVTASREQSTGIAEINSAVSQMDQMTQQNAAMVEETNAASHTLASDTETLSRLVGQFKTGDASMAPPVKRPEAASANSTPKPSPARALANKVAGAFNRGGASAQAAATATTDNWEEF